MSGFCKYAYFFWISVSLSQYCPDYLDACHKDISLNRSLCNLTIIQAACPKACKINGTDCLKLQNDCELFLYTNWIAFLFYGIILFLLLVICIVAYSITVDPKPFQKSYERMSWTRLSRKKRHVDHIELGPVSGRSWHQGNIDSQSVSSSRVINPNNADRKGSRVLPSSVTDPIRDILSSDDLLEEKRDVCPNVEKNKLPKNNSYPHMEFKVEQGGLMDQVKPSYTVEDDSAYQDPDDEFFKHALVDPNDEFFADPEPPPAPRIGGPRKSQALSKKLEARKKAMSKNPEKYIQGNQDTVFMKKKAVRTSESSCEVASKTSSKMSTPRAYNPKNYKLNPSFEAHQRGQSSSSIKMSSSGKLNSSIDLDTKVSGTVLPNVGLLRSFSQESKESEHPPHKPSIECKNSLEQTDNTSKVIKSRTILNKSIKQEDITAQTDDYLKSNDEPPEYQTPRKFRKRRNDAVSVYELKSSGEMSFSNFRSSSTNASSKSRLSELKESVEDENLGSPTDGS